MAEPLSLQHTAQLVCIRTLLDLTHGKDIREYLKLANHRYNSLSLSLYLSLSLSLSQGEIKFKTP